MTADEILKALEESEGFYLEVGNYAVGREDDSEYEWGTVRYTGCGVGGTVILHSTLREALEYALKDGKP